MEEDSESSSGSEEVDLSAELSEEDVTRLMECEKQLKENPNLYDTHVRYVTLLRSAGLKQKLANARRAFQKRFPLSEKLWLEWIEDESEKEGELLALAVEDYMSVTLWKRRLEFVYGQISTFTPEGLEHWRDVSEQALEICGMHFSRGHEIWNAVIECEKKILEQVQTEDAEECVELIRQRYFSAMQCPLLKLDEMLESYGQWEQQRGSMTTEPPPNIKSLLPSTRQAIEARKQFEDVLSTEDMTELLGAYVAYCTMEERHGSMTQVECIYERAVAAFPVTHTLWLQYGWYMQRKCKSFDKIDKVYFRATRNCPWLGQLWERRIRSAALYENAAPDIQAIYDQALQAGLQSEEDYIVVILAWLDFLRCDYWKQKTSTPEEETSFETLNNAFAFAWSLMKSYFPKHLDRQHRILRYWADCLINITNNMDQARSLWEDLLTQFPDASACYETWMFYIAMEVSEKHHGPARKLYSRAFHAISDPASKYTIALEWRRHEGMTGSPKQYATAFNATEQFLNEYVASTTEQRNQQLKNKAKKMPKLSEDDVTHLRRHRSKSTAKPQQTAVGPADNPEKPFYDDKNTLFVSRIADGTDDAQLRALFDGCGVVTALRHMRHPNGVSKGRAYVVFADEAGMREGLKKNNSVVDGRKLLIQISRPTRMHPGIPDPGRLKGRRVDVQKPLSNEDFRKMLR